jgi:putative ABC transport system permease protein
MDRGAANFPLQTGESLNLNAAMIDTAFFGLFDIEPIAGRLFDDLHGEDHVARNAAATANPSMILNESAARALGYAHAPDAVGKMRYWNRLKVEGEKYWMAEAQMSQIVGVVPDVALGSIRNAIEPTVYFIEPGRSSALVLRLDGQAIAETMRSLESAWKSFGSSGPLSGRFMSQILNERYADIQRQVKLFAAFSAVAIIVGCLGLLGLAVFTAERRTREIGVRKALGASRADILRFIGWQFARPVLIANVLAWPAAWFFMQRWLEGFAYRVDLGPLAFLLASGLALIIAFVTVVGHAIIVARARPVDALRYE